MMYLSILYSRPSSESVHGLMIISSIISDFVHVVVWSPLQPMLYSFPVIYPPHVT